MAAQTDEKRPVSWIGKCMAEGDDGCGAVLTLECEDSYKPGVVREFDTICPNCETPRAITMTLRENH